MKVFWCLADGNITFSENVGGQVITSAHLRAGAAAKSADINVGTLSSELTSHTTFHLEQHIQKLTLYDTSVGDSANSNAQVQ